MKLDEAFRCSVCGDLDVVMEVKYRRMRRRGGELGQENPLAAYRPIFLSFFRSSRFRSIFACIRAHSCIQSSTPKLQIKPALAVMPQTSFTEPPCPNNNSGSSRSSRPSSL